MPFSFSIYRSLASATAPLAAACLALLAAPAPGDILIDDFSGVGIYHNPWPFIQLEHGMYDNYELVPVGTIAGDMGPVRESLIHSTMFANPGVDSARMGVDIYAKAFEYTATDGVANWVEFAYGYAVVNCLHADFSNERGYLLTFNELEFGPDPSLKIGGLLVGATASHPIAISPDYYVTAGGPQSVFLPFQDFEGIEQVDLTDIGSILVSMHVPAGTDFSLANIIASRPAPGDANGDGTVDVLDVLEILTAWGPCYGCLTDFNDDGIVNVEDLLLVLANWT